MWKHRRYGIALVPLAIVGLGFLWGHRPDALGWFGVCAMTLVLAGFVLGADVIEHLARKREQVREQRRRERIARWHCPDCGTMFGPDSPWTSWGFDGKETGGIDRRTWPAELRNTKPRSYDFVLVTCVHCGTESQFHEESGLYAPSV